MQQFALARAILSFVALIALLPGPLGAADHDRDFAIVGVDVVPMDEDRVIEDQVVVVIDGNIQSVSSTAATTLPDDIRQIDGSGRYLMPGLADLHTHIRHEEELVNYVAWGVTTVMHLGGSGAPGRRQLDFRERIAKGTLLGPNIYATDRILDGKPALPRNAHSLETAHEARRVVRDLKTGGYDFVKIYNNVSRPVFDAIVAEAREQGLSVIGHIPRSFDPLDALRNGQDVIAHTEELFFTYFDGPRSTENMNRDYRPDLDKLPALLDVMVANRVAAMPDLSFTFTDLIMWDGLEALWTDTEFQYMRPDTANMWQSGNINRRGAIGNFIVREQWKYSLMQALTLHFQEAGILQVVGTDSSLPGLFPGKAVHRELTELVKCGLSNFDTLSIGTRNAGDFVRRYIDDEERFGMIKAGYRADMVLLDANPLEDVRNARKIHGVAVGGRYVAQTQLDERRAALQTRYRFLNKVVVDVDAAIASNRMETGIRRLVHVHRDDADVAAIVEDRINSAGYGEFAAGNLERAREILALNTELFPDSANTWHGLAELALTRGDRQEALRLYRETLAVDPEFTNAAERIEEMLAEH